MLLAGDIGGTKTNLAIFSSVDELRTPVHEGTFPSAQYPSLELLVRDFLAQGDYQIQSACFGVAGPVIAGKAKITNLPWVMEEAVLQQELGIPSICLLNDLVATASGVPLLQAADLHTLNAGSPVQHGTLAVIAPGTGLGEAFLTWNGTHYQTSPSEGGHVDFGPTSPLEIELLRYMLTHFDHVSYELVCSGMGLPNIYGYFRDVALIDEPEQLAQQIARLEDPTPLIVRCALDSKVPSARCVATLETFTSILGAETGNLMLKVMATGGVYIGGGIPPRILPFLDSERFTRAFRHKGRFSDMLAGIPVHVITNPRLALLGAAYHGFLMNTSVLSSQGKNQENVTKNSAQ
ncbi:MAG: glucokinase [Ktedonobacteraceae bacterium]|nr:glucokinase [Ktedonobacteraceae bacterium]